MRRALPNISRVVSRIALGAIVLLILAGCISPPPPRMDESAAEESKSGAYRFDLAPRNGSPLFLGVSPRLYKREEEQEAAIRHIAEQAARYRGIEATYRYVGRSDGRSAGYVEEIDAEWQEEATEEMVERVTILSSERTDDATFVIGTVTGLTAPRGVEVSGEYDDGQPAWIADPPRFPGYLVGVGISQRKRSLKQSFDGADAAALGELLLQSKTTLRLINDRRQVEGGATRSVDTMAQEAAASLDQFYVLRRYATADGRYFYSLAIAEED